MTRQQHARALRAAFAFTIAALAVATGRPPQPAIPTSRDRGGALSAGRRGRSVRPRHRPRAGAGLKQAVLVENRPGAGGNIGMACVARAKADGYTLGLAPSARKASIPSCTPT